MVNTKEILSVLIFITAGLVVWVGLFAIVYFVRKKYFVAGRDRRAADAAVEYADRSMLGCTTIAGGDESHGHDVLRCSSVGVQPAQRQDTGTTAPPSPLWSTIMTGSRLGAYSAFDAGGGSFHMQGAYVPNGGANNSTLANQPAGKSALRDNNESFAPREASRTALVPKRRHGTGCGNNPNHVHPLTPHNIRQSSSQSVASGAVSSPTSPYPKSPMQGNGRSAFEARGGGRGATPATPASANLSLSTLAGTMNGLGGGGGGGPKGFVVSPQGRGGSMRANRVARAASPTSPGGTRARGPPLHDICSESLVAGVKEPKAGSPHSTSHQV